MAQIPDRSNSSARMCHEEALYKYPLSTQSSCLHKNHRSKLIVMEPELRHPVKMPKAIIGKSLTFSNPTHAHSTDPIRSSCPLHDDTLVARLQSYTQPALTSQWIISKWSSKPTVPSSSIVSVIICVVIRVVIVVVRVICAADVFLVLNTID